MTMKAAKYVNVTGKATRLSAILFCKRLIILSKLKILTTLNGDEKHAYKACGPIKTKASLPQEASA